MHVSVTVLGAKAGNIGRAAGQIVGYLEGNSVDKFNAVRDSPSRVGSSEPDLAPLARGLVSPESATGYYADSADSVGKWRGQGALPEHFNLGTEVNSETFRRVLLGQDPHTSQQLLKASGSSGRARGHAHGLSIASGDPDELVSGRSVAEIAGVDDSYIRRLANKTAKLRLDQARAVTEGSPIPETPGTYLDGTKQDGQWVFTRAEAERFAGARKEPQVMLGFDITWSAPKSVSALYAQGTPNDKAAINESIEAAVAAGMDYIERNGFHVRRNGKQEIASKMTAASYRHDTNRALEPQLHEHVVVANMATNSLGETRAVDARGLFAHATTAGYLAGAELRTQLTARLGLAWNEPHKGLADIEGIDRATIMAISSRRQAVLSLSEEMGSFTANARQKAALATRPSKDNSVDPGDLHERWRELLTNVGFDLEAVDNLRNQNELQLWSPTDTGKLFGHLSSHRGVTEQAAIFDRRDVLQAIATYANDRMGAAEIEDLADQWLGTEAVIPLEVNDGARRETIGFGKAQVSLAPDEQRYTTPQMLAIEQRVTDRHRSGIDTGHGVVGSGAVETAITQSPVSLGADQASIVRAICTSGDQFQAVVGRAGAGKTTALRAAIEAWEHDGSNVIGAAPFGEAARNLETETGLRSYTLEGLLTRIETAGDISHVIGNNTVIVIDEASTIGNRQLDRLYRHASEAGATVRMIGDPHQHQSVEAGGLWKHIANQYPENTPTLETNRRQTGTNMGEVRLALDEYRHGQIAAAIGRLDDDSRIVTATSWEELLDTMATDWFVDHQNHTAGNATESKMIAERNSDRHALNQRAQLLLYQADLVGPDVVVGDTRFHLGDRVVAQAPNPDLRDPDANRRDHVINGSQGTITAIRGTRHQPDLVISFDGLGEILVPYDFITANVGPGRGGGLTPGYAVTSFKAEGQTYDTGRNLAAPGAVNTEGMYVALTRGRNDQRTYTINPEDQRLEPPELPIITDDRTALEALSDSLSKPRGADLASVADPNAIQLAAQIAQPVSGTTSRALDLAESRIAATAVNNPDVISVAALGARPPIGNHRTIWDAAIGEAAVYRAHWETDLVTLDGSVEPPSPGQGPERYEHYDQVNAAVVNADIEHLTRLPLPQILEFRTDIQTALPSSPNRDLDRPEQAVAAATNTLWEARERLDAAQHEHEAAQPRRTRRQHDPNNAEAARREVIAASQSIANAERRLEQATQRLRSSRGDSTGRAATQARLAALDRSIDRRIGSATKRGSPYLTETLGERPVGRNDALRWDKTAKGIETYRHRQLGLTPENGPLPGEGLETAIGAKPVSLIRLRIWKVVRDQVDAHIAAPLEHDAGIQQAR